MAPLPLLLLLACADPPAVDEPPADAGAEAVATEADGVLVMGLELGRARHEEILAWIRANGMSCQSSPAPARTSFRYSCKGDLPRGLLQGRGLHGVFSGLLVVRPDEGPAHHLSATRQHLTAESGIEDYQATVDTLSARLGTPTRSQEVPAGSALDSPLIRYATDWLRPSLEVGVSLMRMGDGPLIVQERWTVPTPEAQQERAAGRAPNPHVLR